MARNMEREKEREAGAKEGKEEKGGNCFAKENLAFREIDASLQKVNRRKDREMREKKKGTREGGGEREKEGEGRGRKRERRKKRDEKREPGSRIIKIHKITDAVAISDALLTLAIQLRPRDACKFSSGGRSLATFFVECHCVCRSRADPRHTAPRRAAPTTHPLGLLASPPSIPHPNRTRPPQRENPPRITLPVVIRLASHSRQQIPSPSATHCHHHCHFAPSAHPRDTPLATLTARSSLLRFAPVPPPPSSLPRHPRAPFPRLTARARVQHR